VAILAGTGVPEHGKSLVCRLPAATVVGTHRMGADEATSALVAPLGSRWFGRKIVSGRRPAPEVPPYLAAGPLGVPCLAA